MHKGRVSLSGWELSKAWSGNAYLARVCMYYCREALGSSSSADVVVPAGVSGSLADGDSELLAARLEPLSARVHLDAATSGVEGRSALT